MKEQKTTFSRSLIFVWLVFVIVGYGLMIGYGGTAAREVPVVSVMPGHVKTLSENNLLVCLHPQCPCSQATVAELEKIIARTASSHYSCNIYLSIPDGKTSVFADGPLLRSLENLKARYPARTFNIIFDGSDQLSKQLLARTSGHVFLFDEKGKRLFDGGITSERGHAGDNLGADFIVTCLEKDNIKTPLRTPVFGCSLENNDKN